MESFDIEHQTNGHATDTNLQLAPTNTKATSEEVAFVFVFVGRGEVIRTLDPQHPMLVRYQAALRPVNQRGGIIWDSTPNVKELFARSGIRRKRYFSCKYS